MTKTRLQTIWPGLEMPLTVPPPSRKYIGGWRSLLAPFEAANEMRRRRRARDQEHPDIIVYAPALGSADPNADRAVCSRREARVAPQPISDQTIEPRAFIDFVEMRKGFALEKDSARLGASPEADPRC